MSVKLILVLFLLVILSYALFVSFKYYKEHYQDYALRILLVHATWCSHCERYLSSGTFDQVYNSLKKDDKYQGVVFEKIDYDQHKDIAEKYDINSFPTIIAVDANGKLLDKFSGDRDNKSDLVKFVDKNLS